MHESLAYYLQVWELQTLNLAWLPDCSSLHIVCCSASRVDDAFLTAALAGYTLDILQSASIYAEHASRPRDASASTSTSGPTTTSSGAVMEIDDLRIAVSSKLEHSYSSPLPKEFLLNLASQINKVPLPVIPDSYGIRLPHERERLTAPNWDLEPVKERRDLLALEEQERQKQAAIDTAANMQANASTSAAVQDMDLVEQGAREDLMGGAQQEDEDEDGENEEEEAEGEGEEDEEDEDEDEDDDEMEDALQSGLQAGAEAVNTSAQEGGDNSMNGDDEEDAEGSGEASGADA